MPFLYKFFGRDFLVSVLIVVNICFFSFTGSLAQQTGEYVSRAQQVILIDADTGAVLYQFNADDLVPPASLTKLMTLEVLFKALKEGQVKLQDEFTVSANAWKTGGAPSKTPTMFLPPKSKVRVDDLIQGIIVQSANDASITVAEGLAKTETEFAKIMQSEARRIGMKRSIFKNSTGLFNPEHLMSARDLALLSLHLISEYPEHYKLFSQTEFSYGKHKFYNRNPLLAENLGVDGLKTGSSKEAGFGMAFSAYRNGKRLVGVVLGLKDDNQRRDEARRLLEWGQKSFARFTIFHSDEVIGRARVWGGSKWYTPLTGKGGDLTIVLPRYPANQKLKAEIIYQSPLKPPIRKGDEVGMLRVTSSSNATTEVPLVAMEDVERGWVWSRGVDSLIFLFLRWANL